MVVLRGGQLLEFLCVTPAPFRGPARRPMRHRGLLVVQDMAWLGWVYVHYIHGHAGYCSDKFCAAFYASVGSLEIAMCPRKDPPALTFGSVYHCGVVRHGWRERGGGKYLAQTSRRETPRYTDEGFVLKRLRNMHDKKKQAIIAYPAGSRTHGAPDLHAAVATFIRSTGMSSAVSLLAAPCSSGPEIFKCSET